VGLTSPAILYQEEKGVASMKRMTLLLLTVALAMVLACTGVVLAQDEETTATSTPEQEETTTPTESEQNTTPEQAPATNGQERAAEVIPDQYIVVLEEGVRAPRAVARDHAQRHSAQVLRTYQHAIKGYAARIPDQQVDEVRADRRVDYVEADVMRHATAQSKPWGIVKIGADVSSTQAGNGSGTVSNVNVYIIDSGIYRHTDLNLVNHVNFAGGRNTDCDGHGTHVAGTAAAKDNAESVVGVAPDAPLTGVKVLGCSGSGADSRIIAGIDWVTANAKKPAVANMSLGGPPPSQALDDAVMGSVNSGIFYSIAAGNDAADSCGGSPEGTGKNPGVITVGATNTSDRDPSWSNYGPCVDFWAPGVSILSTSKGGGTTTFSGTSMSAPHVAGGAALYLSRNTTASPLDIESALKDAATTTSNTSNDGSTKIVRENVSGF
jgi:subtilisin family serine protease